MDIIFPSLALFVFVVLSSLRFQSNHLQWLIFEHNYDIYRILPNGTQKLNLTASTKIEYFQSLSPDGQWIIFLRDEDNSRTIYRMRVNGSQPERLTPPTDPPYWAQFAAWTPDNQWLLYTFGSNIFRMRPDGTERQPLTDTDRVESVVGA